MFIGDTSLKTDLNWSKDMKQNLDNLEIILKATDNIQQNSDNLEIMPNYINTVQETHKVLQMINIDKMVNALQAAEKAMEIYRS
jgi:hypothetical protein